MSPMSCKATLPQWLSCDIFEEITCWPRNVPWVAPHQFTQLQQCLKRYWPQDWGCERSSYLARSTSGAPPCMGTLQASDITQHTSFPTMLQTYDTNSCNTTLDDTTCWEPDQHNTRHETWHARCCNSNLSIPQSMLCQQACNCPFLQMIPLATDHMLYGSGSALWAMK